MDDDKKKPAGAGGKGRGPKKPFTARDGDKKPFQRQDGAKRAYANRDGAAPGKPRPGKWERREDRAVEGEDRRPGRPYAERAAGGERSSERPRFEKRDGETRDGDKKPFQRQDGAKRAYANRDGGAPGKPRPGKWERREERAAGSDDRRPRKPYAERTDDGQRSERPRFEKRDGEARPFRKPDGDRPFRKPDGGKPFRKPDGEKRPYASRDGGPQARPHPERQEAGEVVEGERIARRLARAGISSRRDAETLIAAGRVRLNGKVLQSPAVNVTATDRIELDGKEIPAVERTRLFLFHKPAGVVTTNRDPEGRRTVFDILPEGLPRLMTVGRLDINTEGLLLLTNDGGLSRVLELPATGWLRRYRARVHGKVEQEALDGLKEGIAVDGTFYGAIEATLDREQGSNAWLTIGFREGKNREVKNVLGALGLDVNRLIRVSYGPFQLGELAEGEVRELKGKTLRDQLGERLIAESGADFDAPILNEFSNKPVSAREQVREEERGERPNRKREREQKREDALGRLDTRRPPRGAPGKKPFGKPSGRDDRDQRDDRSAGGQRSRTANVWMAPGARPLGEKKKAELAERNEGRRYAGKPRPVGDRKPAAGKPGGFDRPRGPRKPRDDK